MRAFFNIDLRGQTPIQAIVELIKSATGFDAQSFVGEFDIKCKEQIIDTIISKGLREKNAAWWFAPDEYPEEDGYWAGRIMSEVDIVIYVEPSHVSGQYRMRIAKARMSLLQQGDCFMLQRDSSIGQFLRLEGL